MKFYDYCAAPSPRRARIFMAEKGIEIETEQVDLGVKAQFEPAYRAVNPRCTVPALVLDDGTVLSDNTSIARYLEEVFPDPPLLGTTPVESHPQSRIAPSGCWTSRTMAYKLPHPGTH